MIDLISETVVNILTKTGKRTRIFGGSQLLKGSMLSLLAAHQVCAASTNSPRVQWQSTESIERSASDYISTRLGKTSLGTTVAANKLDPRLRLAACDSELEAFLRPGTKIRAKTVVGVRCTGSRAWKVYVPVNLVVTAEVLTPTRTLRRGHLITADDLARDERDVSRMHTGYFTHPEELVGQRVRTQLTVGRVISPNMIEADMLVKRGQTVTLSVSGDSLAIRMSGKALQDGGLHQRIRVKNDNSGRIVEGVVRSSEHVEVLVQSPGKNFTKTPKVSAAVADTQVSNNDR